MYNYNSENRTAAISQETAQASTVFLAKVFNWMAVGLALTGVTALFTAESGLALKIVGSPLFMILIIAELGLVFFLSATVDPCHAALEGFCRCFEKLPHLAHSFIYRPDYRRQLVAVYLGGQ